MTVSNEAIDEALLRFVTQEMQKATRIVDKVMGELECFDAGRVAVRLELLVKAGKLVSSGGAWRFSEVRRSGR